MEKVLPRLIAFLVIAIGIILGATSVYAVPLTGNEVENCVVTLKLKDTTGVAFTDDVEVIFTDISLGDEYSYILTYAESYGIEKAPTLNVQANTTYTISLSFPHSDVYSIVNADGSAIKSFAATTNGATLDWIVKLGGASNQVKKIEGEVSISTGNEEADKVFSTFINATKHIETDDRWTGFLHVFDVYAENRADAYVKYCKGTKDEWLNKTSYEQFLYYELYLRQCEYISASLYDYYYGSEQNFVTQNIFSTYNSIKRYGKEEAEAYKAIMLWQYQYIKQNGTPFNFMSGINYLEVVDPIKEKRETLQQDKEAMEQVLNDVKSTEKKGHWNDALFAIKGNLISVLILIVLVVGLFILIIYRKRKNIDGDKYIK